MADKRLKHLLTHTQLVIAASVMIRFLLIRQLMVKFTVFNTAWNNSHISSKNL